MDTQTDMEREFMDWIGGIDSFGNMTEAMQTALRSFFYAGFLRGQISGMSRAVEIVGKVGERGKGIPSSL
jgi:hypothetical protein